MIVFFTAAALARCQVPTSLPQLTASLREAELALESDDLIGFEAQLLEARWALECLEDPIRPESAQALHLLQGVSRWDPRHPEDARPYLAAAAPIASTKPDVISRVQGPPLATPPQHARSLPPPLRGQLLIDGTLRQQVNESGPYVLQHVQADRVLGTWYLDPGAPLPAYPRLRQRLGLIGSSGAAASLACLGGAALMKQRLYADRAPDDPYFDDDAYFERTAALNRTLYVSGVGLGGVSAATLVALGASFVW